MPIQDSDLFLININSDTQSFKITASKLKDSLATNFYNNYKLLVNKPDYTSRFVYTQNLQQSVAPTDYMMVERAGVSYKVNGQQIIDYFPSVPAGAAGPIINVGKSYGPLEPTTLTPTPSPNVFRSCPPFNSAYSSTLQLSGSTISYTFDGPWDMSSVTKYRGGAYDAGQAITLTFTDANGRSQSTTDSTAAGYAGFHALSKIDFSVPIAMVTIAIGSTPGWFWGFYDSSDQGVNYPDEVQSITDQLTLGSTTNLDLFTAGDAIKMVNSDGDVASYVPVTSTIASIVGDITATATSTGVWVAGGTPSNFIDGSKTTYYNAGGVRVDFSPPVNGVFSFEAGGGQDPRVQMDLYDSGNNLIDSFGGLCQGTTKFISSSYTNVSYVVSSTTATGLNTNGCGWYYMELDNEIISSSFNLGTILTFASPNQDLKYFYPGDAVGQNTTVISTDTTTNKMVVDGGMWSDGSTSSGSGTWLDGSTSTGAVPFIGSGGFTNMFDGVLETNNNHATIPWYTGGGSSFNGDSFLYFNPPITSVSKVQFWGYLQDSFTGGYPSTCFLIDGNGTEHSSGLPMYRQNENIAVLGTEITPVNGIVAIKVNSQGNGGFIAGVYFDGTLATWLGPTKVTGPAKSGTGNFLTNAGPVVDITNSNNEWIDNTNRLGEEFFIKDASTRTGLAILRTKAIKAATAIAQAKEDIRDGDFAIVNNNYWFRDEDTFIDLGPINLPSK